MPYTTQWITTPAFTPHLPCVGYLLNPLIRYSDLSVDWLQQTVHTLLDAARTSSSTCAEGQKTAWGQEGGKSEVLAASLSPGVCLSRAPSCLVFSCHLGVCEMVLFCLCRRVHTGLSPAHHQESEGSLISWWGCAQTYLCLFVFM